MLRSPKAGILLTIIHLRGRYPMLSDQQLSDLARNGGGYPKQTAATKRPESSLKCLLPTDMLGGFEEQRLPNSVRLLND